MKRVWLWAKNLVEMDQLWREISFAFPKSSLDGIRKIGSNPDRLGAGIVADAGADVEEWIGRNQSKESRMEGDVD